MSIARQQRLRILAALLSVVVLLGAAVMLREKGHGPAQASAEPLSQRAGVTILTDASGDRMAGDELLVRFADGTSHSRMQQIAAAMNGEIIGQPHSSGMLRIRFEPPAATPAELDARIRMLCSVPGVDAAMRHIIFTVD